MGLARFPYSTLTNKCEWAHNWSTLNSAVYETVMARQSSLTGLPSRVLLGVRAKIVAVKCKLRSTDASDGVTQRRNTNR